MAYFESGNNKGDDPISVVEDDAYDASINATEPEEYHYQRALGYQSMVAALLVVAVMSSIFAAMRS